MKEGEKKYLRNLVCTVKEFADAIERMTSAGGAIGFFGAGVFGYLLHQAYSDVVPIQCFIDNHKAGGTCLGKEIVSLAAFREKYPDGFIVISSKKYYSEIHEQLLANGVAENKIINFGTAFLNGLWQYYDLPQMKEKVSAHEVFVDGGCLDGVSAVEFAKWCEMQGGHCDHVYAWEPDAANFEDCERRFREESIDYTLIEKGMWDAAAMVSFSAGGGGGSHIVEESKAADIKSQRNNLVSLEVASIDETISERVTYIKMDIEGAELRALQGARKTIERYRPKLAICIYHKPEDVWEIPQLIHEINPDYKMYMRHYSFGEFETVLYAI